MAEKKRKNRILEVKCPVCQSELWIDAENKEVIKHEKGARKKGTLEELLAREKERKKQFGRRFEATAELSEERKKKAHQKFKKFLTQTDKD